MEAAFRVSARVSFSSLARIPCIDAHTFILFKGSSDNAESEALKRDSPWQVGAFVPSCLCVRMQLLVTHVILTYRNQNSSQDSAASSLTAEKMPHWQDRNPTPERLQAIASTSSNRRKRLVRQFSLWVHENSTGQPKLHCPHDFSSPVILLLCSNHEDEDNLPEALAAISSQSTGKSGSTSSLDKQIQPSIYPQVTCAHTQPCN